MREETKGDHCFGSTCARSCDTTYEADLFASKLLLWVLQQLQWQFLLSQKHCVSIIDLSAHFLAELIQLLLTDHSGVSKPTSVRLDASGWQLLGLKILEHGERVEKEENKA